MTAATTRPPARPTASENTSRRSVGFYYLQLFLTFKYIQEVSWLLPCCAAACLPCLLCCRLPAMRGGAAGIPLLLRGQRQRCVLHSYCLGRPTVAGQLAVPRRRHNSCKLSSQPPCLPCPSGCNPPKPQTLFLPRVLRNGLYRAMFEGVSGAHSHPQLPHSHPQPVCHADAVHLPKHARACAAPPVVPHCMAALGPA